MRVCWCWCRPPGALARGGRTWLVGWLVGGGVAGAMGVNGVVGVVVVMQLGF